MTPLQKYLLQGTAELKIRLSIEPRIILPDGKNLNVEAHFPDFGFAKGTLIFEIHSPPERDARQMLLAKNYSISTLSAPEPEMEFDRDSFVKMLSDWTWNGPDDESPVCLLRDI